MREAPQIQPMASEVKDQVSAAVKDAMRARDKERLAVLRTVTAEFKKVVVDERIELDDARVLAILVKQVQLLRDAAKQYADAGRTDLEQVENFEIEVIQTFLPAALSEDEIEAIVAEAITQSGAQSMQDMGKVMGIVKPQVQGRGDMGLISKIVKSKLA